MKHTLIFLAGAVWAVLFPVGLAGESSVTPAAPPSLPVSKEGTDPKRETAAVVPYVRTDGEIRVLPRTRPDRQYQLYIGLPASFHQESTRKYPVVFVSDGYWSFTGVRSIYWSLLYDKTLPEVIIVGLGYAGENLDYDALRNTDLMPRVQSSNVYQMDPTVTGEAEEFLHLISTVIIPLMEREYRADPQHRVLMGGSLGGLFTLYALFTKPTLFHGYVAASPVVGQLRQYEDDFARSGQKVDAKVFISVGEMEAATYQNDVVLFSRQLTARNYLRGGVEFREYAAMRHDGAIMLGFTEGLQSVCAAIAPEHGMAAEIAPELQQGTLYAVYFNRTSLLKSEPEWTAAQNEVMQNHRRRLEELVRLRKILYTERTPDGSARTYASLGMLAHDKSEAEQLAAADPAVVAGLMGYEVMCLSEKPDQQAK